MRKKCYTVLEDEDGTILSNFQHNRLRIAQSRRTKISTTRENGLIATNVSAIKEEKVAEAIRKLKGRFLWLDTKDNN